MKCLRPARQNNEEDIDKVVQTYRNLREKKQFQKFTLGLVFCEFLNFVSVIACMGIFDAVLDNQFWNYGSREEENNLHFWDFIVFEFQINNR